MENRPPVQIMQRLRVFAGAAVISMVVAACGGATVEADDSGTPDEPTTQAPVVTTPDLTTEATEPTTAQSTTTGVVAPLALDLSGDAVTVSWDSLASTPFFAPAGAGADPLFLIHTNPAEDGFFLSFEM